MFPHFLYLIKCTRCYATALEATRTATPATTTRATAWEAATWEAWAFLSVGSTLATCTISCDLVSEGAEEVAWHEVTIA